MDLCNRMSSVRLMKHLIKLGKFVLNSVPQRRTPWVFYKNYLVVTTTEMALAISSGYLHFTLLLGYLRKCCGGHEEDEES